MGKYGATASQIVEIYTKLSDYDYHLPKEFIAQQPPENRADARLLVLHKNTGRMEHRVFSEITGYFSPGDFLVLNDTKVIPARLQGKRAGGASVEILFIEATDVHRWEVLLKSNAKLKAGEEISVGNEGVPARLLDRIEKGKWHIEFDKAYNVHELIHRIGEMPLPPYIKRDKNKETLSPLDRERYQTVFARKEGAIAAPTAGLHFTNKVLEEIRTHGVETGFVTLHAGLGTFLPIKAENILEHHMHKEYYECTPEVFGTIQKTKERRGRVVAAGSTSCRVLETIAANDGKPPLSGWTDLFLYPPYVFKYVDVLITNFHLPKTTLLVLVSAFAGRENILNAYETAKREGYRFFSYGDCMMIV